MNNSNKRCSRCGGTPFLAVEKWNELDSEPVNELLKGLLK